LRSNPWSNLQSGENKQFVTWQCWEKKNVMTASTTARAVLLACVACLSTPSVSTLRDAGLVTGNVTEWRYAKLISRTDGMGPDEDYLLPRDEHPVFLDVDNNPSSRFVSWSTRLGLPADTYKCTNY
jgi:hypothetical protein